MQEDWSTKQRIRRLKTVAMLIMTLSGCVVAYAQDTSNDQSKPPPAYQAACPALLDGRVTGKIMPPLSEGSCGEKSPLQITAIGTVRLGAPVILNCRMATALYDWLAVSNEVSLEFFGSALQTAAVSTSYQCRRRNNQPDGKISEHGFANALDILGFTLADGNRVTIAEDWPAQNYLEETVDAAAVKPETPTPSAQFLRTIRDAACERFTTVLGPEANAFHADHFHLDLGCHGKRCTYKICE